MGMNTLEAFQEYLAKKAEPRAPKKVKSSEEDELMSNGAGGGGGEDEEDEEKATAEEAEEKKKKSSKKKGKKSGSYKMIRYEPHSSELVRILWESFIIETFEMAHTIAHMTTVKSRKTIDTRAMMVAIILQNKRYPSLCLMDKTTSAGLEFSEEVALNLYSTELNGIKQQHSTTTTTTTTTTMEGDDEEEEQEEDEHEDEDAAEPEEA